MDAESVCGIKQLCAGLKCSIEAGGIHAATDLFQSLDHDHDYGILNMDAWNAFNSINRLSLLWNLRVLWPRASRFIFNTYRDWSPLILKIEQKYFTAQKVLFRATICLCLPTPLLPYL